MKNIWARLCVRWSHLVFGARIDALTPRVRSMRLLEEAIELAQAEHVAIEEVQIITEQVYAKPPGDPYRELGGILICASTYAGSKDYDLELAFWHEFERIMDPRIMERVRTRNLEGDKIGISKVLT